MRYLLSVIDTVPPTRSTPDEEVAIDAFNDKLQADGRWVLAAGLDAARVVDNRGDRPIVSDGPFAETKECIAGFWLVEAADDDEAMALATEGSRACNRKVEVRAFL